MNAIADQNPTPVSFPTEQLQTQEEVQKTQQIKLVSLDKLGKKGETCELWQPMCPVSECRNSQIKM
jgi:hypothetical protein